jgi:transposase
MKGADSDSESQFSTIRVEEFLPASHPLRPIRICLNDTLAKVDERFSAMDEADLGGGHPSIAPEKLMRAMLLQVLFSIRSERQLVEQINHNLLFRWFVGLSIDDAVWDQSVFSQNRDRLIKHDAVTELFNATVSMAEQRGPLSREHFSVDGTLIKAWASHKSMRRKDGSDEGRPSDDWRGELRSHEAHESRAHDESRRHRKTVAADKADGTKGSVKACRAPNVAPHVAQNINRLGRSAIDGRTTRHEGEAMRMRARTRIEPCFGWGQTVGPLAQLMVRGPDRVDQLLTLTTAACNLTRWRALAEWHPQVAQ